MVHLIKHCYSTLKEIGLPSDLDNSDMLSLIEQKMCADDRKVWSHDLEKTKQPATLNQLMTWMIVEMKSRMRATAPLRTGNGSFSVHDVNKVNDDWNKAPHNKCWLCKSPTHWPDQSQKFAALNADDRLKAMKDNHPFLAASNEPEGIIGFQTVVEENNVQKRRTVFNAHGTIIHCYVRALTYG